MLDHLTTVINGLDEKPIIIGPSFGGLLTQLMLQRDLGAASVAVDGAPPMGLLPTQWSFIRFSWPHALHRSRRQGLGGSGRLRARMGGESAD